MPQIINTNIASINAQRNLDKSQSANQQALQRLSSGLRINSAKDDAAGLAISTRFTSQIKGLNVAVRNAGDGIALAQTAEGALGSINNNLQRIRELAVQSANATNSEVDREALQAEVEQLVAEITRTSEETDFNGRKLLDGSFKATFQIGANAGQTLEVSIAELTADKLGSSKQAGVSAQGTNQGLSNGDLVINGEAIRSSVAGDDKLSFSGKEASAIAKVAAINEASAKTGVTATVAENVVIGSKIETNTATPLTAVSGSIKLNGVEIALQGTNNTSEIAKAGTRNSVITAINAASGQTGVVAEDGGANGGVILKAADGRNITIELGTGTTNETLANLGLAKSGTNYAGFTLTAANASTPIKIEGGNGTGNGDIANAGLKVGSYTAQTAATSSTKATVGSDVVSIVNAIATDGGAVTAAPATPGLVTLASTGADAAALNTDLGTLLTAFAAPANNTGSTSFTAPAAFDATTNGTAVDTFLQNLMTAVGGDPLTLTSVNGAAASLTDPEVTAVRGELAKIVTAYNTNNPSAPAVNAAASSLELNDGMLNTYIDGLNGAAATPTLAAATSTMANLYDELSGIEGFTVPSSWATGGADAGTTIEDFGLDKLAAAFSSMQEESPAVLATNRGLQDGDLVINGVTIAASSALDDTSSYTGAASSDGAASAIAIAAAINKASDSTGVKAEVNATEFVGSAPTGTVNTDTQGSTMTLTLNGVEISLADQGDYEKNKAAAISAINERAGETGVTAKDNGVSLTLTAADGRNISMYAESNFPVNGDPTGVTTPTGPGTQETSAANFGLTGLDTVDSVVGAVVDAKTGATTVYGTVTLSSSKAFEVSYGTGGAEGLADSGLVAGKFGGGEDGQALSEIDISTFEGAQAALTAVDNAIAQVASQRADLGAIQNRMESTVSNLKVTSENLSAANSRIQDADFAAETAELSRTQVLQQAGISILAQANASGQNVLSLLG